MANMDTVVNHRSNSTIANAANRSNNKSTLDNNLLGGAIFAVANHERTSTSQPSLSTQQELDILKEAASSIKADYDKNHKGAPFATNKLKKYDVSKMETALDVFNFFNDALSQYGNIEYGKTNKLIETIKNNAVFKERFELIQNTDSKNKGKYELVPVAQYLLRTARHVGTAQTANDPKCNMPTEAALANQDYVENKNLGNGNLLKANYPEDNNPFFDSDDQEQQFTPVITDTSNKGVSGNPFEDDDYPKGMNPFEDNNEIQNTEHRQPVIITTLTENVNSEVPVHHDKKEVAPTAATPSVSSIEINVQQASLLLAKINEYIRENKGAGKKGINTLKGLFNSDHKSKIGRDLTSSKLLGDTFEFNREKKLGYKEGKTPTTNKEVDDILNAFTSSKQHKESGSFITDLKKFYTKHYPATKTAKPSLTEAKVYDEAVKHAIANTSAFDPSHLAEFLRGTSYVETYNQCRRAAATFYSQSTPDKEAVTTYINGITPLLEKIARVRKIPTEATAEGDKLLKNTQLGALSYTWRETILSWVGYTDVNKTTANFLDKEDKLREKYTEKLNEFLEKWVVSASEVGQTVEKISEEGREKARDDFSSHYKKGKKANPFRQDAIHSLTISAMKDAVLAESDQVIAGMILTATEAYEQSFTDNLSNAIKKFDLKKAKNDARNRQASQENTANDYTHWYDAFDAGIGIYADAQVNFRAVTKTAMEKNLTKTTSENQPANLVQALEQLTNNQEVNKSIIINTLADKFRVDSASMIVDFQEEITKITGGLAPSDDSVKNKKILKALQGQLDAKKAIIDQLKKNCLRLQMQPDATNTVIDDFKKALPQDAEIINLAHEQLPEVKSIWRYLKTSFSSLGNPFNKTSLLDKIPFLGALSGPIAKVVVSGVSVAAMVAVGVAFGPIVAAGFLAGGLLGFIGWKIGTAFTAHNASQKIHRDFEALANKYDPQWKDHWTEIDLKGEAFKGNAITNVQNFFGGASS